MTTGVQACNRVRNLTQSLALLRADSFGPASPRKVRRARLRPPLCRQVHATATRGLCFHPSRSCHDKLTSGFFNSSEPGAQHTTLDPHEGPEYELDTLKSRPRLRTRWASPWRGHNMEKFYALGSWADLKYEEGWRLAWVTTPDENAKAGATWCDMHLEHLPTKGRWTASVKSSSSVKAKEGAMNLLLAKIGEGINWYDLSEEPEEIKFLHMMLTNRLTLEAKYKDPHCVIFAKVPGSIKPFKVTLQPGKKLNSTTLISVVEQLIPMMQQEGVWSRLLEDPPQTSIIPGLAKELDLGSYEPHFLELTNRSTLDMTEEMDPDISELSSLDRVAEEPPMAIEKAIKKLLDSDERSRSMFYRLMAMGRLRMKMKVSSTGSKTCRVSYAEELVRVESIIQAGPSEPILRSQLETRATRLLVAKLWAYKLLGSDVQSSAVWPDCKIFLDDETIWGLRSTKDRLVDAINSAKRLTPTRDFQSEQHEPNSSESLTSDDIQQRSKQLSAMLKTQRGSKDPKLLAIQSVRSQLPVFQIGDQILELINENTYSVISAETGSGKSTQVPQIMLDDAIDRGVGGECKILCVQPRRIAAQLLAERVAEERGQRIGRTVGSVVRFDRKEADFRGGSITYCTTGIMLNYLQNTPQRLDSVTHIILDEVHVRDLNIDFTMLLLKRYVDRCRAAGIREPRIVIMSATVDLDLFTSYFRNIGPNGNLIPAPHISLPGRAHYVKKHYLADILEDLKANSNPKLLSTLLSGMETRRFLVRHHELFSDSEYVPVTNRQDMSLEILGDTKETSIDENPDEFVPFGLISALVLHILTTTGSGSILIFLPGMAWIETLAEQLNAFSSWDGVGLDLSDDNKFRILQLHATLPDEMERLSHPVPEGCRRILLSTDVAEASVTLPDVKYVIDSGKINMIQHNSETHARRLECSWASQSSAIQRQGRAGRVQDGEYFFLGMKKCYDNLRPTKSSEMQREDLAGVCLRGRNIAPDVPIRELLQQTIEPPDSERVDNTIETLKLLKAFDAKENVTSLGNLISKLAVPPRIAKLVILGLMFRCLDSMIIIAAIESNKSCFPLGNTPEERRNMRRIRSSFAEGSSSDHVAELNAFKALRNAWTNRNEARAYADANNLSFRKYAENFDIACALFDTLARNNLLPPGYKFIEKGQFGRPNVNVNSDNIPLIKALIAHSLSEQISAPKPFSKWFYYSATESDLYLRLSSAARDKHSLPPRQLLAYSSKRDSSTVPGATLELVSPISPLAVCLLGGRLVWKDQRLRMNNWLSIPVRIEIGAFTKDEALHSLFDLRKAIDQSLEIAYDFLAFEPKNAKERWRTEQPRNEMIETLALALSDIFQGDNKQIQPHIQPKHWDTTPIKSFHGTEAEEAEHKSVEVDQ